MPYTRALRYTHPFVRGEDVLKVQLRLPELGITTAGRPDGVFGQKTAQAVEQFQREAGLRVDGIVGPLTWNAIFGSISTNRLNEADKLGRVWSSLKDLHGFMDSVQWRLTARGLEVDKKIHGTSGEPQTVRRVWREFGAAIEEWATTYEVPCELVIATICTETHGDPSALREEPGYTSDDETPHRVSPGIMQTLISTARDTLGDDSISREWLLQAPNSIRAGTGYIARQWKSTHFDPPKVACAYNAGGIYHNGSDANRWKMRQYPINTGHHADRFIQWFNDSFAVFGELDRVPNQSFFRRLTGDSDPVRPEPA